MQSSNSTERDFLCPLTGTTLRQPVTLPCQHSFCKAALERYLVEQGEKWTAGGAAGPSSDRSSISSSAGMIDDIRRCPQARNAVRSSLLEVCRLIGRWTRMCSDFSPSMRRWWTSQSLVQAPRRRLRSWWKGKGKTLSMPCVLWGLLDEQIAWALEAPSPAAAAAAAAGGAAEERRREVDEVRRAVCQLLREDTTPAPHHSIHPLLLR